MIDVRPKGPPVVPAGHACDGDCACGIEPLAHPKYSFGMLLEARHLALEHRYAATRMNTHDIRLHDFGTVCGLRVDKHPSPECVNSYAILRPGIALDCCGREIVVPEDLYVPLYDGARSGWCGAPAAAVPALSTGAGTSPAVRTKLYIYLAFAQCETDPVPSYVKACGCCNPCEHGGSCVPSVIREGYELRVTTTPPVAWRNPVGAAFCSWLEVQLKGPGALPYGAELAKKTLDQALCEVILAPCADICANGNDALLLATLAFDATDALTTIDNCTDRRFVLSTGAIVEALACLTAAQIACCAAKEPYLALTGTVSPANVNLAAPPPGDTLTYTVTVTNSDATKNADAFGLRLAFPGGLAFSSATLAIDGAAQPNPAGDATGVSASLAGLAAGKSAALTVVAMFDASARAAGDVLTAQASVASYSGPSAAAVPISVTFTNVLVDGPRVVFKDFPQSLTLQEFDRLLTAGWPVPFTAAMAPASAVAGDSANGSVFLDLLAADVVKQTLPITLTWSNANQLLTVAYDSGGVKTYSPIGLLLQGIEQDEKTAYALQLRLLGGGYVKGATATGPTLLGADGQRLDGDPPAGGPPQQHAGQSGNGEQGGDFNWHLPITR